MLNITIPFKKKIIKFPLFYRYIKNTNVVTTDFSKLERSPSYDSI